MRRRSRILSALFAAVLAGSLGIGPVSAGTPSAPTDPSAAESSPAASSSAVSSPTVSSPADSSPTTNAEPTGSATAAAAPATEPIPPGTTPDDQPPAGAKDGLPVGDPRPTSSGRTPSAQVEPSVLTPDRTQRYFGSGPWNAIKSAADNQSVCGGLTHQQLQAMVLTTIFRESAGATSAGSEPAPMTLSRYDEWSGKKAEDYNINANYGLYAFRNPSTSYKRVFWHPGIGIWQYDSAGVGAPYTAAERINTSFLAPKVAAEMRNSYCSSNRSTPVGKRYDAWAPWSLSCQKGSTANATYCEEIYQGLMQAPAFNNVTRTAGFSASGGAVLHTCALSGAGSYPCWLIDPTKAQGATWWATLKPLDGGAPNRETSPATPISTPFYVIKRNGLEQRYWLATDSGYSRDVTGTRVLGKNARPKDNQSGSGVTWSYGSGLCDVTAGRGACTPGAPPAGLRSASYAVNGTYTMIPLDIDGNGLQDLLLYGAGPLPDRLWLNKGNGKFTSKVVTVNGRYRTIVAADVDGNGAEDLIFYDAASSVLHLGRYRSGGTISSTRFQAGTDLTIKALDRNGDGRDELLLYRPGGGADAFWDWRSNKFVATPTRINGKFQLMIGDFDNNHRDDIFFYAPGSADDYLWLSSGKGGWVSSKKSVKGNFHPFVGDLDGDRADDIVWYAPGAGDDYVWFGAARGNFQSKSSPTSGHYQPVVVDVRNDGHDQVLWYAPGPADDYWKRWDSARRSTTTKGGMNGTQTPIVGGFSAGGADGILWYAPGAMREYLWYR